MARWVVVDDTDSNIQYSGSWSLDNGKTYASQGNFGAPYMGSLHSTKGGQASFSYTFDGSAGQVFGTTNVKTSNGVQDPTWECKVDGTTIKLASPFQFTENNWVLCQWDSSVVSAGKHTVTVTAKSSSQAFLFDYFRFVASPGANYQNAAFFLPFTDAAIQYGNGWGNLGTIAQMATNGGAQVTISFYGTGLMWYGDTPVELPHGATTAEYSIDGQPATTFNVPGSPGGATQYIILVFQTGSLPLGWHTLVVTSRGTTSVTPLVLANLIVQGGSLNPPSVSTTGGNPAPSVTAGSSSVSGSVRTSQTAIAALPGPSDAVSANRDSGNSLSTSSSGTGLPPAGITGASSIGHNDDPGTTVVNATRGPPIGAIVGGVLGGVAIILLVLAFIYVVRRSKKNRDPAHSVVAQPFYRDIPSDSFGQQQVAQTGDSHFIFSGQQSPRSEPSSRSVAGSSVSLLQRDASPNVGRSKYQEARGDTPQTAHSSPMAITHEDSGYRQRMPQANLPPPTEIVEYPPVYTPG